MDAATRKALLPFRETVKLLCGILTAIAFTDAVEQFAVLQKQLPARTWVSTQQIVALAFVLWLMFRFFFGNIVYLNSDTEDDPVNVVVDGLTILLQSVILAYLAQFTTDPSRLYVLIAGLLISELVWFTGSFTISKVRHTRFDVGRRVSASQGLTLATVALLWVWAGAGASPIALWWGTVKFDPAVIKVLFGVNSLADLWVNGPRYFGYTRETRLVRRAHLVQGGDDALDVHVS